MSSYIKQRGKEKSPQTTLAFFDLGLQDKTHGMSALHMACSLPSLSIIIDLLKDKAVNCIALDSCLKIASEYIPLSHLTSKKNILVYERERVFKLFYPPAGFGNISDRFHMIGKQGIDSMKVFHTFESEMIRIPDERQADSMDFGWMSFDDCESQIPRITGATKLIIKDEQPLQKKLSRISIKSRGISISNKEDKEKVEKRPISQSIKSFANKGSLRSIKIAGIGGASPLGSSTNGFKKPISSILTSSPMMRSGINVKEKKRENSLMKMKEVESVL